MSSLLPLHTPPLPVPPSPGLYSCPEQVVKESQVKTKTSKVVAIVDSKQLRSVEATGAESVWWKVTVDLACLLSLLAYLHVHLK